jgi:CheY-like chemotaxis protein
MAGKILVLDDEENYAEMLRDLLVQEGFRTEMVTKPHDALKILDDDEFDLVIADYKMPLMDGADFMERARARHPSLPIIMVSGLMNTPELVKVANMDVTLVLEKPFDVKAFIAHVRRFATPMTEEERADARAKADNADAEAKARTYPGLAHLADGTEASRQFAQHLWDASHVDHYLFVGVPPGGEIELVTCELSDWAGFASLPIHQFSISQIESLDVLQTIRELPGQNQVSKLVAITDFGEATPSQIEFVQKLIAADPKLIPNGRELKWVFFLDITRYPQSLPENGPEIFDLVKKHLIVLPPLRARVADLATYLRLHLDLFARREGDANRARLAPAAVSLLLAHAWPGNYLEVMDVARRIIAIERAGPLSAAETAHVLGLTALPPAPAGLAAYLLDRQCEYLEEAVRRAGTDPAAVLKSLKVDPAILKTAPSLAALSLIYPDLVPGG